MPSVSSITKQYAGGLRQQNGGGVLDFLGMGEKTGANTNVKVVDPVLSEPTKDNEEASNDDASNDDASNDDASNVAAEPSFIDNALSAIGFGKKSEGDAAAAPVPAAAAPAPAAAAPAPAAAPAAAPAPADAPAAAAAPAAAPADAPAAAPAAGDNVTMMDKVKGVFGMGEPAKDDAPVDGSVDGSVDASVDASVDSSVDVSEDEEEEDTVIDFEKLAEEIQSLRKKYQELKDENKKLKSAKKQKSAENAKADTSEFSKMIASLFAIKGSVAQLQLSLKKHANQNGFPVDGLGLDEEDSESESESDSESEVKDVVATPLEVVENNNQTIPEPVSKEIPEIPVNGPASDTLAPAASDTLAPAASDTLAPAAPAAPAALAPAAPAAPAASDTLAPAAPAESVPAESVPEQVPGAAGAAGAAGASSPLFSGGKNHYILNMKKNKTHRHHKRLNRHQTLRAVLK